ncbi:MAG TPA: ATP-binding cassette domain-containing protein, partial [Candidatus Dormibacteraeota bacterium]
MSLRDVGVAFGAESILEGVTFRVETRQRIAVVGANGAGKTTLLTLISGALEPTQGEVEWQRGLRIGYLPQDAPEPVAETILDEVMASREDLAAMHHEMTTLEPLLADSERPDAAQLLQR